MKFLTVFFRAIYWKIGAIIGYVTLLIIDFLLVVIKHHSWKDERFISNRAVKKCWEDATSLIKQYK